FLEARRTKDRDVHHLLDRPRDRPTHTALGVATIAFYSVLFVGGASDVLATEFGLSVNQLVWAIRGGLVVVPIGAAIATRRLCRDLAARDPEADDDPPDDAAGGDAPVAVALDEPGEAQPALAWPPPPVPARRRAIPPTQAPRPGVHPS
ncbi:MAG: cytochrome b, partial [Acidimicrobiales bacterium]